VISVSFAAGYSTDGGYAAGVLLGAYKFAAGQFFVNSFGLLENLDKHPAADRLLLNLIQHASGSIQAAQASLPEDFASRLKKIGYVD